MENKDERLWQIATQRAQFKGKVFTYLAVNAFLWILWWFTHGNSDIKIDSNIIPWPAWVSLGWGFGLVLKYVKIYHLKTEDEIQKEYDKLKNN